MMTNTNIHTLARRHGQRTAEGVDPARAERAYVLQTKEVGLLGYKVVQKLSILALAPVELFEVPGEVLEEFARISNETPGSFAW